MNPSVIRYGGENSSGEVGVGPSKNAHIIKEKKLNKDNTSSPFGITSFILYDKGISDIP